MGRYPLLDFETLDFETFGLFWTLKWKKIIQKYSKMSFCHMQML